MACHIICFVSFRFVSFRFDLFRFVSICFVSFRSVSFRSVSFLFRFALYRDPTFVVLSRILAREKTVFVWRQIGSAATIGLYMNRQFVRFVSLGLNSVYSVIYNSM